MQWLLVHSQVPGQGLHADAQCMLQLAEFVVVYPGPLPKGA